MFKEIRDVADDVFISLPPPVASNPEATKFWTPAPPGGRQVQYSQAVANAVSGIVTPPPPVDMRNFNDRDNPCFHGDGWVHMADGTYKLVRDLCRGDVVMGSFSGSIQEIECVVRTDIPNGGEGGGGANLVALETEQTRRLGLKALLITPWHPVLVDGKWIFPSEVPGSRHFDAHPCEAVYSFIVKELETKRGTRGNMVINGVEVATLGHGIVGDSVVSHGFYGTRRVIESLKSFSPRGFDQGLVVLSRGLFQVLRDPQSGLVVDLLAHSSPSHILKDRDDQIVDGESMERRVDSGSDTDTAACWD